MNKLIKDITGSKFGNLRVLKYLRSENRVPIWLCRCEYTGCNRLVEVKSSSLRSGRKLSCGQCDWSRLRKGHAFQDLRSQKFGRLQPLYRVMKDIKKHVYWHCRCDCGNECDVSAEQLKKGETVSCGCYHKEVLTKWNNDFERWLAREIDRITQRCYNKNCECYDRYGGRGITVCDEWRNDNRTFVKWALESGARRDLSIDRINTNGPYAPWNCRWVDMQTQANNRNNNRVITVDGVSMTISQWATSLCEDPQRFYKHTDEELVGIIRAML